MDPTIDTTAVLLHDPKHELGNLMKQAKKEGKRLFIRKHEKQHTIRNNRNKVLSPSVKDDIR